MWDSQHQTRAIEPFQSLGINIDIIDVDYRKKEIYDKLSGAKKTLSPKNIFSPSSANWKTAVDYIVKKYGKDVVVFHGEGADSLHNHGFSQDRPTDKISNYLFGPTFFRNIKKDKIYDYLLSFIFSDTRIPCKELDCPKYVKKAAFDNFKKWLRKEYFEETIKNINEKNLYFYFSYLYSQFHLQSPQIRMFKEGLKNVVMPYLDNQLKSFLYKMPENWGRGLNDNPTKYPIKVFAKKIFNKTQLESVTSLPHSYLSEVEYLNIFDEYLLKGESYRFIKDTINKVDIDKIFDDKIFNVDEIEKFVGQFNRGELKDISKVDANLITFLTFSEI